MYSIHKLYQHPWRHIGADSASQLQGLIVSSGLVSGQTLACSLHVCVFLLGSPVSLPSRWIGYSKFPLGVNEYINVYVWFPANDWHPIQCVSCLAPNVPGIDSTSTSAQTRIEHFLMKNEVMPQHKQCLNSRKQSTRISFLINWVPIYQVGFQWISLKLSYILNSR